MGLEIVVRPPRPLAQAMGKLAEAGFLIAMVDGQLVMPTAPLPGSWTEVRLRTAAGMLTVKRRGPDEVAVIVFGNASPELVAFQQRLVAVLEQVE